MTDQAGRRLPGPDLVAGELRGYRQFDLRADGLYPMVHSECGPWDGRLERARCAAGADHAAPAAECRCGLYGWYLPGSATVALGPVSAQLELPVAAQLPGDEIRPWQRATRLVGHLDAGAGSGCGCSRRGSGSRRGGSSVSGSNSISRRSVPMLPMLLAPIPPWDGAQAARRPPPTAPLIVCRACVVVETGRGRTAGVRVRCP